MGVVYRIDFPDGYFYIGKSKDVVKRIMQHYSSKDSHVYARAKKYCLCAEHLMQFTSILYRGDDYFKQEFVEINKVAKDKFIINKEFIGMDKFRTAALSLELSMTQLASLLGITCQELNKIRRNSPDVLTQKKENWDEASMLLDGLMKENER